MPVTIRVIEKDLGWEKIIRDLKSIKGINAKIGLFGEGDPEHNVAARGVVHQFGSDKMGIPRRPFMSEAFDSNLMKIINFIKNEYYKTQKGVQSIKQMIKNIAVFHEGQISKKIIDGNWIANKPATILRKGSSRPLIDKAIMRGSIKSKIVKAGIL